MAFLATGDELVQPGTVPGPHQIVASVTPTLAAMVRTAGADALDLGIAADDVDDIARRASDGLERADVLVTLGGASVGDHDLVQPALARLGITPSFWRVAVRPGKPLMFFADPLVLGLPGNPVSGVVCTLLFLIPLLEAMQGLARPGPHPRVGTLATALAKNGPRRDHLRAAITENGLAAFPVQDSSMLSTLSEADALIIRPPHAPAAPAGSPCEYLELS